MVINEVGMGTKGLRLEPLTNMMNYQFSQHNTSVECVFHVCGGLRDGRMACEREHCV